MMSDFQHTFTVRQHTPLIHFQADQDGAFLRVSELKPAFDRYLWEKVFKEKGFENHYSKLVGYNHKVDNSDNKADLKILFEQDYRALDYTLDIELNAEIQKWALKDKKESFPCFFAAMGNNFNVHKQQLVFTNQDFNITITCFNPELLQIVINEFAGFLSSINFGARQSKGFGSFTVVKNNTPELVFSIDYQWYQFQLQNVPNLLTINSEGYKNLFKTIEVFWQCLRNGFDSLKIPSALEQYVTSREINSCFDKGTIREIVRQCTMDEEDIDSEDEEDLIELIKKTRVYRDVLGLASSTTWKLENIDGEIQEYELVKTIDKIERVQSPIYFKPVKIGNDFVIYILCRPHSEHNKIMNLMEGGTKVKLEVFGKDEYDETVKFGKSYYVPKAVSTKFKIHLFIDYVIREYTRTFKKDFNNKSREPFLTLLRVFTSLKKLS